MRIASDNAQALRLKPDDPATRNVLDEGMADATLSLHPIAVGPRRASTLASLGVHELPRLNARRGVR